MKNVWEIHCRASTGMNQWHSISIQSPKRTYHVGTTLHHRGRWRWWFGVSVVIGGGVGRGSPRKEYVEGKAGEDQGEGKRRGGGGGRGEWRGGNKRWRGERDVPIPAILPPVISDYYICAILHGEKI